MVLVSLTESTHLFFFVLIKINDGERKDALASVLHCKMTLCFFRNRAGGFACLYLLFRQCLSTFPTPYVALI